MRTAQRSDEACADARRDWMAVLAKAPATELGAKVGALGPLPGFDWLRKPETGAVMVRGRAGATGAPFNVGEMTVTRCALRLADGLVGHAYVAGRDHGKARLAAICDALLQGPRRREVEAAVVAPLRAAHAAGRASEAGRAEATRVQFFTMVRGED